MNGQHPDPSPQLGSIEFLRVAIKLAGDHVISLIECECRTRFMPDSPHTWWDVEPLSNANEYGEQLRNMHAECMAFARGMHLIEDHPSLPHTVRIVHRPS